MKKTFWAILLLFICLCIVMPVMPVFAQEEDTVISDFLAKIGVVIPASFVVAFVTVMLGYLRNTPPEDFDITKFLGTLIFAILLGVVTTVAGWDYTTAEAWLGQAGITIWVYWAAKVIAVKLGWAEAPKSP